MVGGKWRERRAGSIKQERLAVVDVKDDDQMEDREGAGTARVKEKRKYSRPQQSSADVMYEYMHVCMYVP